MEAVPRLAYLLQRPLVRVAREAQRFARLYGLCSKHEIISSIRVILSPSLADTCIKAGHRAAAIFAVNSDNYRSSKSFRAGLELSVGKFHRWMSDVNLGYFVQDFAAIYLTAAIENLIEELILLCLSFPDSPESRSIVTVSLLDAVIAASPDLYGLLQPSAHLNSGTIYHSAINWLHKNVANCKIANLQQNLFQSLSYN